MKEIPLKELKKLLNLVAQGDNKAVETIYRHYQASVYAFIRLRVRDDDSAEELLNDTFMIAIQKPLQYTGTSSYKTWLCGIAKNVCGTWIRKQHSGIKRATIDLDEETFENLPDPNWSVLEQVESREKNEILSECIDSLLPIYREVFFWTWFEEEPMEVVAERLGCPVGTVKSRLFNARAKIADCVKNAYAQGAAL